jgi:opacity protein-like surface antigen
MANWTLPADCKTLCVAAVLGLASTGSATAVDLPPAPTLPAAGESTDEFSGWYLRGDIGAGFETAPDLGSAAGAIVLPDLSPYAVSSFRHTTLSPSGTIDAGVGYVFNPWMRMDGMLEYRFGGRFQSTDVIGGPASFAAADNLRGSVSSILALVNGYVDLGNWWGVTPFVGAGMGVADNALSGASDQGFALSGAGAAVPVGGFFSNASRTNFAWALMAGLDVDIAPNLKLELSYRYLNVGSIAVGGVHCFPGVAACARDGVVASSRGWIGSNDVRVGLVWLVDQPAPAPAPVVMRY